MNTTIKRQENRYLESPHAIRETGLDRQAPFSIKNFLNGGCVFSQEHSFFETYESDDKD